MHVFGELRRLGDVLRRDDDDPRDGDERQRQARREGGRDPRDAELGERREAMGGQDGHGELHQKHVALADAKQPEGRRPEVEPTEQRRGAAQHQEHPERGETREHRGLRP